MFWHTCCCCYHKGRNFQANHNKGKKAELSLFVVVATTKVGIFKQITTNQSKIIGLRTVVVATTKVGIFKQITTDLFPLSLRQSCCCYHKGRNFQANHNALLLLVPNPAVVVATTKVGIFKQITTLYHLASLFQGLLLLPQR